MTASGSKRSTQMEVNSGVENHGTIPPRQLSGDAFVSLFNCQPRFSTWALKAVWLLTRIWANPERGSRTGLQNEPDHLICLWEYLTESILRSSENCRRITLSKFSMTPASLHSALQVQSQGL